MKELSTKEKAQRYDEAIEKFDVILNLSTVKKSGTIFVDDVRKILPELKESDDERILREIKNYIKEQGNKPTGLPNGTVAVSDMLAWLEKQGQTFTKKDVDDAYLKGICDAKQELEKQGEQKPDDNRLIPQKGEYYVCIKDYYSADGKTTNTKGKIYKSPCDGYINDDKGFGLSWINSCTENCFRPIKEEDWIICEQNNVIGKPLQYKEFMNNKLIQKNIKSLEDKGIVPNFRLWDISDAKDGDVLACNEEILLFKSYSVQGRISLYCWYNGQTNIFHSKEVVDTSLTKRNKICPATKEQRDILFQKMKETGYEYDAEKKELKKIVDEEQIKKNLQDNSFRRMFEQKSTDKVEPKFHQGEWITNGDYTWKIVEVKPLDYILQSQDGNIVDDTISHVDEQFHSFTIEDAKDGDVLVMQKTNVTYETIFIFKEIKDNSIIQYLHYFTTDVGEEVCEARSINGFLGFVGTIVHPATKEQRDTLEKAMDDAGWEFDFEKRKLKKLGQPEVTKTSDQVNVAAEWSEEDEEIHRKCICAMRASACGFPEEEKFVEQVDNWLKSLKDRYTWKPSDEQLNNMLDVLIDNCPPKRRELLESLYKQLKKL